MMKLVILSLLLVMLAGCKLSYKKSKVALSYSNQDGIFLNTKVCLEAPFDNDSNGVEMRISLNENNLIPRVTPYASLAPWYHYSPNDLSLTPDFLDPDGDPNTTSDRIFVDWVLVEIYQEINGKKTYVDGQSALIHYNGTIYDTSGYQGIYFPSTKEGKYYINIIHRNHLSIGSHEEVLLGSNFSKDTYNIDFTDASTLYLNETTLPSLPYVTPGANGKKCLRAGDLNGDLTIDSLDEDEIASQISQVVSNPPLDIAILGYLNADVNFDGQSQLFADAGGAIASDDLSLIQNNTGVSSNIHVAD